MTVEDEKCSADDERGPLIAINEYLIASNGERVLRRHRCDVWRWVSVRKQVSWARKRRLEPAPIAQPFSSTMLGKLFHVDRQNDIQPYPLRLDHFESALRASRSSRITRLAISICRSSSGS